MKNKKMLFILIPIAMVIILAVVLGVAFLNKENEKSKKIDVEQAYIDFLINEIDKLPDTQSASVYDIDFNGIEELLLYKKEKDTDHITIYTVENEVKKVKEIDGTLCIAYVENEGRYYYTYTDKNNEKYVIKTLDNFEKNNEIYNDVRLAKKDLNKEDISDSFLKLCSYCRETIEDFDFEKTYEIAKTKNNQENTSSNTIENTTSNTTENGQGQNLCNVAQIGDYVNYMGSDKNWRILNFYKSSTGENIGVYLIYSSYLEDGFDSKGSYETLKQYLERDDIFTNYLDESVASKVVTSVSYSYFESALEKYYSTIPDLFDVGVNYNLAGEKRINYFTTKLAYYEDGSGEVSGNSGWSKKIRPGVILKENISTTGKNANGAWVLSGAVKTVAPTENTEATPIEEEPQNTFKESYLGDYNWEKGNNSITFNLQKGKGRTEFYLLYYPNGYTSPAETICGEWTNKVNIETVENEHFDPLAVYSFSNIKYEENSIEITIKAKQVINSKFAYDRIPDGTYKFVKE